MNLFFAVVEDLSSFAYGAMRDFFLPSPKIENPERVLPSRQTYVALPSSTQPYTRALPDPVSHALSPETIKNLQKSTVMYTAAMVTPLRTAPGATGDAVYTMLPYGSMVMVIEVRDMWAHVACGTYTGWVYVDDLEDRAAHVYPSFHIGEMNDADEPATIRVRALINDEFGAGELDLPLQPEEYVVYKLLRKGIKIEWPPVRPRTPGTWSGILYPSEAVLVESEPKADTLIEYLLPEDVHEQRRGHLAYVEAVFPDQSIQISEVGWPEEGMYNERVLVADEWRALNAAFLSFS